MDKILNCAMAEDVSERDRQRCRKHLLLLLAKVKWDVGKGSREVRGEHHALMTYLKEIYPDPSDDLYNFRLLVSVGHLGAGTEITVKDGLLWANGVHIPVPRADQVAQEFGFQFAEEMVKSLT